MDFGFWIEKIGNSAFDDDLAAVGAGALACAGAAADAAGIDVSQSQIGSVFCNFFCDGSVTDYASAKRSNTERYAKFFHAMMEQGVYLAPSQFEVGFVSAAHTPGDIAETIRAAEQAFKGL